MTNATYAAHYVAAKIKPKPCEKKANSSVLWVLAAIIAVLLITNKSSAQCYSPYSSSSIARVAAIGGYSYNKGFIGNSVGVGISGGAITITANYTEYKSDSARQSFSLMMAHDLWSNDKFAFTAMVAHGTNKYTEFGLVVRSLSQTPFYFKAGTLGIGVGMWVKF